MINSLLVFFWLCMNKDTLAPPIKQKARFKIKDAKCHLRPRNKEKHRDSSRQNLQGKQLVELYSSVFRKPPLTHTTTSNLDFN